MSITYYSIAEIFFSVLIGLTGMINILFAQDPKTIEYLRQEEHRKKAELMRQLDSGVYYMDNAQYTLAEEKFKFVLENIKSVPSDLTFYFGKNSYYLQKFKQSNDWLTKYIQLKGTSGQFYTEASDLLRRGSASRSTGSADRAPGNAGQTGGCVIRWRSGTILNRIRGDGRQERRGRLLPPIVHRKRSPDSCGHVPQPGG